MNCTNCGAALQLVESRRYLQCRHCDTYHFSDAVEAHGIRIVAQLPDALDCPVCTTAMAHAVLDNDHPIDFCVKCRGVLLPRRSFAEVTHRRRAWTMSPPAAPVPLDREALGRHLLCPRCGGRFDTYPYGGPGNVVIDGCARCDLIWLDFGEMDQIVDAPGRDRGNRQMPRVSEATADGATSRASLHSAPEPPTTWEAMDPLGFLVDVIFKRSRSARE
jgi:Zn-finger nucleic acid-binding protein